MITWLVWTTWTLMSTVPEKSVRLNHPLTQWPVKRIYLRWDVSRLFVFSLDFGGLLRKKTAFTGMAWGKIFMCATKFPDDIMSWKHIRIACPLWGESIGAPTTFLVQRASNIRFKWKCSGVAGGMRRIHVTSLLFGLKDAFLNVTKFLAILCSDVPKDGLILHAVWRILNVCPIFT